MRTNTSTQYTAAFVILLCCFAFTKRPFAIEGNDYSIQAVVSVNDSVQIKKNIVSFLRWYEKSLHKAAGFQLLVKNSKGYFTLNKKACAAYLGFMQSSGYLSPKYIGYWQKYFDDKAIMLKKEKIMSDIPEGFDLDFVLITQEPELVFENIDSLQLRVVSLEKTAAVMSIKLPSDASIDYQFEMEKTKAGWQISYISTPNFD